MSVQIAGKSTRAGGKSLLLRARIILDYYNLPEGEHAAARGGGSPVDAPTGLSNHTAVCPRPGPFGTLCCHIGVGLCQENGGTEGGRWPFRSPTPRASLPREAGIFAPQPFGNPC
jgi:hypothetical protein